MFAPHFKDEIASLKKWPFLAGFDLFWFSCFYCDSYLLANHAYFAKNCPQMSFAGPREDPNILHSPFDGSPPPTRLTNPSHKS